MLLGLWWNPRSVIIPIATMVQCEVTLDQNPSPWRAKASDLRRKSETLHSVLAPQSRTKAH